MTAPATPRESLPTLRVTPLVGIAPLAITVATRLAKPLEDDRELELVAVEGEMVLRRSVRDIFWEPTLRPASVAFYERSRPAIHNIQPGIGHMYQPVAQSHRAAWTLSTPGSYHVVACVWPAGRCVHQSIVVQ